MSKKEFVPSKYQERIFQHIIERALHAIVVSAVPGAGKTETIRRMIQYILPQYSVVSLAFNSDAAKQLGEKMKDMMVEMVAEGKQVPSVASQTIHQLGNAALKRRRMSKKTNKFKYNEIVKACLKERDISDRNTADAISKLIEMVRLTLNGARLTYLGERGEAEIEMQYEEALALTRRFEIDLDPLGEIYDDHDEKIDEWPLALEVAQEALEAGIKMAVVEGVVDFCDMIWLPVALRISPQTYDYVLVDEAQDLSPCQRALVLSALRPNGYFVAVGDRNQAIYGFAGASLQSLDEIIQATGAVELPLSICYRCPPEVVARAARIYPGIEPAEGAKPGLLKYIHHDAIVPLLDEIETRIAGQDKKPLILSRMTAPLVTMCLELLREGKRANVKGKDLGAVFSSLMEKIQKQQLHLKRLPIEELPAVVLDYRRRQIEALEATGNALENEAKIDSLNDRIDTLLALLQAYLTYFLDDPTTSNMKEFIKFQDSPTIGGFIEAIKCFFKDNPDAQIILSTGHRSKGLEYEYVIILDYDQIPHPKAQNKEAITQELNLKYVMTTRAKKELYLVVQNPAAHLLQDESTQTKEVVETEEPVKVPGKRGRPATGRTKTRQQYSLPGELVEAIAQGAELYKAAGMMTPKGEKIDQSSLLTMIVNESPIFKALLEAIQKSENPEPPEGPNGGGLAPEGFTIDYPSSTGESIEEALEEERFSNAAYQRGWSQGYTDATEDHLEEEAENLIFDEVPATLVQIAPVSLVERPLLSQDAPTIQRIFFTCKRRYPTPCKNVWCYDYFRRQDGTLYRVDENGVVVEFNNDYAKNCTQCGKHYITTRTLMAKYSESHDCNDSCRNARIPECSCACGGQNHGLGRTLGRVMLEAQS